VDSVLRRFAAKQRLSSGAGHPLACDDKFGLGPMAGRHKGAVMEWGTVADWVSGLGSISASIIALYLAGSERRARRERERPEVSVEVGEVEDDGWADVTLIVLNPAHKEWQLFKAEMLRPTHGVVATQEDTMIATEPWNPQFSTERRAELAGRSKNLRRTIRSVGSMNAALGGGGPANKIWVRLSVFVGKPPVHLVLRLFLASLEPKPDRFTIDVERTVE
jgi:hypothetical protein